MPEEPASPSPDTPPPNRERPRNVGTAFAGETTRSMSETPRTGDETIRPGMAPQLGVIGGFEILGELGKGGMGAVYRARQVSLDRVVALKILPSQFEADADFVSRFQREARLAASLTHANLVKVYSSGVADGCHYIAMELIEGETLGQWLKRGALPTTEALRICLDVTRALDCGWRSAQLIHRDIKPGNIFLSAGGAVKLGDLGLAKTVDGDTTGLTQTGTAMGTPHYISPEQARGDKDLDFRADIYSLGCTLYQMLTGRTPYEGRDPLAVMSMHLNSPPPAIMKVMPQCPIPLARLVGKMLKKQRRERHGSYEELITAIESVQAHFAPKPSALETKFASDSEAALRPTAPSSSAEMPTPPRKSKLPLYGGIAGGVVAVSVAAFVFWPKEEKLTLAQIYMRDHAGEQYAAVVAPEKKAGSTTAAPEPVAIKLWDSPEKIPPSAQVRWEKNAVRLDGHPLAMTVPVRDVAIRTSILLNPDAGGPQIHARVRHGGLNASFYSFGLSRDLKLLVLGVVVDGKGGSPLKSWPLPRTPGPDEWLRLELRIVGDDITASADGKVLGIVHDSSVPDAGEVVIFAQAAGYFRDTEYVPLDKPAGATPPTAELWRDVLRDGTKLDISSGVERTPEGLRFATAGSVLLAGSQLPQRDGSVRIRTTFGGLNAGARVRVTNSALYSLYVRTSKNVVLVHWDSNALRSTILGDYRLPEALQPGQDYELELRIVGQVLAAKLNGAVLGSVSDASLSKGRFGVGVNVKEGAPTLIKSLEILDLDSSAPARAASYPAPAKWIDATDDVARNLVNAKIAVLEDESLHVIKSPCGVSLADGREFRDVAVRITCSGPAFLLLRKQDKTYYATHASPNGSGPVEYKNGVLDPAIHLQHADGHAIAGFDITALHELVFAVQGDKLTAWLDGVEKAMLRDIALATGKIGFQVNAADADAGTVRIRKIEYAELPDSGPAGALLSLPPEPWQDALRDPAMLVLSGGVERVPEGLRLAGPGAATLRSSQGPKRDGAVRMRATFDGLRAHLRARDTAGAGAYHLMIKDAKALLLRRYDAATKQSSILREFPLNEPLMPGQDYELELRVMGQTLTAKFNGEILGTVTDEAYAEGRFGAGTSDRDGAPGLVKILEVLDLDAPPAR